jgi:hypothetical protein
MHLEPDSEGDSSWVPGGARVRYQATSDWDKDWGEVSSSWQSP